jgi:hypothetical protein
MVEGPKAMAHQADNTISIQQIVLMHITATRCKTKHHQTKSEKYPKDSYDILVF